MAREVRNGAYRLWRKSLLDVRQYSVCLSAACQLVGDALLCFPKSMLFFNSLFCFGLNMLYNKFYFFMKKKRKNYTFLAAKSQSRSFLNLK